MDLTQLLKDKGMFDQLANQFGLDVNQVDQVVKSAMPELSKSINENTSSEEGLKSFWDALKDHKDVPVEEMISDVSKVDTTDGEKILGHIFGEKKSVLEQEISQSQGLSAQSVSGIMKFLAPIIMGMISKQILNPKPQQQTSGGGIVDSFLGGDSAVTKMAKAFLDKNNNGSILDDLLGGLFGRR